VLEYRPSLGVQGNLENKENPLLAKGSNNQNVEQTEHLGYMGSKSLDYKQAKPKP